MVDVAGAVTPGTLAHLQRDGGKVSIGRQAGDRTGLRFALKGVRPGQIAALCDGAGLQILAMKRIRIGRMPLAGLQPGQWRYLMPDERSDGWRHLGAPGVTLRAGPRAAGGPFRECPPALRPPPLLRCRGHPPPSPWTRRLFLPRTAIPLPGSRRVGCAAQRSKGGGRAQPGRGTFAEQRTPPA